MGTDHPPRDKQAASNRRFGLPNLPTTLFRYLRMPFEGMSPHFGMTNTPKTFTRCLRRMPGFAGLWFSYRTSSGKTSFTQDSAHHGRTVPMLAAARAAPSPP